MKQIGELFGFPVYENPDITNVRPGEVAILAIGGAGMEIGIEAGLIVIRARVAEEEHVERRDGSRLGDDEYFARRQHGEEASDD